jgi:hypothetical protein
MEEPEVIEIIEKMGEFMRNTNNMLASLKLGLENARLDIDRINKELKKYKDNGKRIIT